MQETIENHAADAHGLNPRVSPARPRDRGVAMLLVLIAVAVATVLSMSFLASQASTHGVAQNVQKHAQARSVAESALVAAIQYVQTDSDFRSLKPNGQWVTNASFNGGTFDLFGYDGLDTDGDGVVDDTDGDLADDMYDPVTITVIGYFDGVSHTVHAAVTPGGTYASHTVLMIVDDDSSLQPREAQRRDLMEAWGWAVNLLSDSSSQAEYDAAVAEVDSVLVPSTVSVGAVSTKLNNTAVGVVIEEGRLADDLKLSSGSGMSVGMSINVTNGSHYITETFGAGLLQIATTNGNMRYPGGAFASGAQSLAELAASSTPTVVVLETGAALYNGGIAAGRRVAIPTGGFSVNELTDAAKLLMQRALTWTGGGDTDNFLSGQWTLDEAGGMTAYDSSGNGQDGVVTAGAPSTQWTTGKVWGGMRFDGTGKGFIRIPDSDVLDLSAEGTLSAWIYLEGFKNFMGIIHKGEFRDWSDEAYSLQFWTGRKLALTFTTASGSKRLYGKKQLQDGRWYHVVGTWGPNGMALYVNGVLDASNSTAAVGVPSIGSVQIGSQLSENLNGSYKNLPFVGVIDDARIYRRTLTAEEIKAQYNLAIASSDSPQLVALYEFQEVVPPPPALVGNWPLDDRYDAVANDIYGVAIDDRIMMYSDSAIDSYSSSDGAYGGANTAAEAQVLSNATGSNRVLLYKNSSIAGDVIVGPGGDPSSVVKSYSSVGISGFTDSLGDDFGYPSLSAPAGMPVSSGNTTYNGGSIAINSDTTFNDLTLNGGAIITITGNVRIDVRDDLNMNSGSQIVLAPDATLELYVRDDIALNSGSSINADSSRTSSLTLYTYGNSADVVLNASSEISGKLYISGDVTLNSNSTIYGALTTDGDLTMNGGTAIHMDSDLIGEMVIADDTSANTGAQAGSVTGGVSGHGDGGTAIHFDGEDEYIVVPHDDAYLLNDGAVSFWFKPDVLAGHQGLFSKEALDYGTGGHLHVYTEGSVLKARIQSTNADYTVESTGLSVGNWYHVVVSFGSAGLKLYRNGALVDSDSYVGGIGSNSGGIGNREPIVLGANAWLSGDLAATPVQDFFKGAIDDVRIYDRSLDDTQAKDVYDGDAPGSGPATVVYDTSGMGAPLNLNIEDPENVSWVSGGGLTIDAATRIVSPTAATKLYNTLTLNNQMTLEVLFTPADISQYGPARIVSYSGSAASRNFTLGQDTDTYVTRLRTTDTTSNGTPDISSPAVLVPGTPEHLTMTYDGTNVYMYRNGELEVSLARTGDLNWDAAFRLILGDEYTGGKSWLGTLHRVAVYDKALTGNQALNIFNGLPPGNGAGEGAGSTNWIEP